MSGLREIDWIRIGGIAVAGAAGLFLINAILDKLRRKLAPRGNTQDEAKRIRTLIGAARRVLSTLLLLAMFIMIFSALGLDTSSLWGAAGIIGVAGGLAIQGIAKDIVRGISLVVSNEIRVGDKVDVAGRSGIVEEVLFRRIALRDEDGALHFIPSGAIQTVTNHSLGACYALVEIKIPYGPDSDRAMEAIRATTEEMRADPVYSALILGPIEKLGVDRWTDWSVSIRARMQVAAGQDREIRQELLRRLLRQFDHEKISYPAAPIQIGAASPTGESS